MNVAGSISTARAKAFVLSMHCRALEANNFELLACCYAVLRKHWPELYIELAIYERAHPLIPDCLPDAITEGFRSPSVT